MPRELTPFETWVLETTRKMLADARESSAAGEPVDFARLEQKLAIILVQSRALECRHLYGRLMMNAPNTLREVIDGLTDRSGVLEQIGLAMAKCWPPAVEGTGAPGLIVQHTTVGKTAGDSEGVLEPGKDVPPGGFVH